MVFLATLYSWTQTYASEVPRERETKGKRDRPMKKKTYQRQTNRRACDTKIFKGWGALKCLVFKRGVMVLFAVNKGNMDLSHEMRGWVTRV
jgi:hypothetical protein